MNLPTTFPVARYRLECRVTRPLRLPDYGGSMLRGAFGHALRQLACIARRPECPGCPLLDTCPYPAIFAPPAPVAAHKLQRFDSIPVPHVIEPPPWGSRLLAVGDTLNFHHVLIGRALRELPLIVLAWRRALARGIGAGDGTAELTRLLHCGSDGEQEIHRPENSAIAVHRPAIPLTGGADPAPTALTLRFTTPLRLQANGHALPPEKLQARALLLALARRASLLAEFHGDGPLLDDFSPLRRAAADVVDEKDLAWRDWRRYSSRQQREMRLGGALGNWRLHGPLAPFLSFLRLGQWLHVGKETAFGLGGYTLTETLRADIAAPAVENRERSPQTTEKKR